MASAQYAGVDIYSKPITEAGTRFLEVMGFQQGAMVGGIDAPHLWLFPRAPQKALYDSYSRDAAQGEIGVTLARNFEDLNRITAIRSAVYIGEQECPYEEEFDGNDLAATHLLGYVGPGTCRVPAHPLLRRFREIERLAIRANFARPAPPSNWCAPLSGFARRRATPGSTAIRKND